MRLLHTRLWGGLTATSPTSATFDLLSLGIYAPNGYNFAGTGSSTPADPAAYLVNTGTLDLSGIAARHADGHRRRHHAFGAAPPDFNAIAVTAGSSIEQTLVVDWPSREVAPFSSASSSGYVVDLSKATIGSFVDDIYTGPVGMNLKSLPASPLITTTGADQTNLQLSIGSTSLTTGMSMFATPGGVRHRRQHHPQRHQQAVPVGGLRSLQQRQQYLRCRAHQHGAAVGATPEQHGDALATTCVHRRHAHPGVQHRRPARPRAAARAALCLRVRRGRR